MPTYRAKKKVNAIRCTLSRDIDGLVDFMRKVAIRCGITDWKICVGSDSVEIIWERGGKQFAAPHGCWIVESPAGNESDRDALEVWPHSVFIAEFAV